MIIFAFINAWVISLFIVASHGLSRNENPKDTEYAGAPKNFSFKVAALRACFIAIILTSVLALAIEFEVVALRDVYVMEP